MCLACRGGSETRPHVAGMEHSAPSRVYALRMKNELANLQSGINVTPLVDVVLVLLIIFLVTSPLSQRLYQVSLPSESRGRPIPSVQIMVKQMDETAVYLNQEFVPMHLLLFRLRDALRKQPNASVLYSGKDEL